jgi:hypothetical protein
MRRLAEDLKEIQGIFFHAFAVGMSGFRTGDGSHDVGWSIVDVSRHSKGRKKEWKGERLFTPK